eukprot:Skav212966  [mRNA]  locus=scaffold1345:75962:77667:+ [translate_table: standard]
MHLQDSRGSWRVQGAPKSRGSFDLRQAIQQKIGRGTPMAGSIKLRQSLPKAWCGLRDDELSKLAEIPGGHAMTAMAHHLDGSRAAMVQ